MTLATDSDECLETVRFEVLGPVSVVRGERRARLPAHHRRVILGTLPLSVPFHPLPGSAR